MKPNIWNWSDEYVYCTPYGLRLFSNPEYLGTLAILLEFIYSDSIGNQRGESPNHSLLIHLQLGKEVGKKKFRFDRAVHRRTKNFLNSHLNFHVPKGGLISESFFTSNKKLLINVLSAIHSKRICSGQWFGTFLGDGAKVKNFTISRGIF